MVRSCAHRLPRFPIRRGCLSDVRQLPETAPGAIVAAPLLFPDDAAIEMMMLVLIVSPDASCTEKSAFTGASNADSVEIFSQAPGRVAQRV
jgi:hypothetical protein